MNSYQGSISLILLCIQCSVLGILSVSVRAQSTIDLKANVRFLSTNEGLKDRSTYDVLQDDAGIIWVATSSGVFYFDGYTFTPISALNNPIDNRIVRQLIPTKDGKIWAVSEENILARFDPTTYRVDSVIWPTPGFSLKKKQVYLFDGRVENRLYLDESIAKFRNANGEVFAPEVDYLAKDKMFYRFTPWNTVLLLNARRTIITEVGQNGEVLQQIPAKKPNLTFFQFRTKRTLPSVLWSFEEKQLLSEMAQLVALGDKGDRSKFYFSNHETEVPPVLSINGTPITVADLGVEPTASLAMLSANNDFTWLIFENRVMLFDQNLELVKEFSEEVSKVVKENWNPRGIFIDRKSRLWIASTIGLILLEVEEERFVRFFSPKGPTSFRSIAPIDSNLIAVNCHHGILKIDPYNSQTRLLNLDFIGVGFAKMEDGRLLSGSHSQANLILSGDSVDYLFHPDQLEGITLVYPWYSESFDTLYHGTSEGLFYQLPGDDQFHPFGNNLATDFTQQNINFHQYTPDGLWVAGSSGVYLLYPNGISDSLTDRKINVKHFYRASEDVLWLATFGEGLIRWNRKEDTFESFTTQEGLSNDVLYAVYPDTFGHLWLPSNFGLMRFDTSSKDVVVFHEENGIANEEFNTYSHYQSPDGRLFFGGIKGITQVDPSAFGDMRNRAPVVITQLKIPDANTGDLEDHTESFKDDKVITLAADQKFFSLSFSLLDYDEKGKLYAWKIPSIDPNWNYQQDNTLRINGLPPGQHELLLKAKGSGETWGETVIRIPILVAWPYYFRWPFILATSLALFLITYLFLLWRTRRLAKEQIRLNQLVNQRTSELSESNRQLAATNRTKDRLFSIIAHDLKAPVISLRGIGRKVNYLLSQQRYEEVQELGETVESAVNNTKSLLDNLLNWALLQRDAIELRPEKLDLLLVLQEVVTTYESTAFAKNIELKTVINTEETHCLIDHHVLTTVLRNLVDNAIKFSHPGQVVTLELSRNQQHFQIAVRDQGVGIPAAFLGKLLQLSPDQRRSGTKGEKSTGLGLVLCHELIQKCGGKILVDSQEGKGSVFTVVVGLTK